MSEGMMSVSELARDALDRMGSLPHIPAREGDFVGDDGYLHCGKCGGKKEFRLPINGRMVPSMCPCQKAAKAAEDEAKEREQERNRINELLSYSLIDASFYDCTFANFAARDEKEKKYLRRLRNYADNFSEMYARNKGLLLYGPPGTGKTFGAACIANKLIADGVPVFVTSVVKLTGGGVFDDDMRRTLNIMRNARLLVIDDLGAERNTDFKSEQLFEIIDSRINSKKPMIITSNIAVFKDNDIRRQRVYDRLSDACIPIRVDGESRRRQAAQTQMRELLALLDGGGDDG